VGDVLSVSSEVLFTVAAWGAAFAGVAAGTKGISYLARSGAWGFDRLYRAGKAIAKLAAIGNEDAWPNGSTDLPTFLHRLYGTVTKLLEFHQDELREWEQGISPRPSDS
jgi:hypothetical protein